MPSSNGLGERDAATIELELPPGRDAPARARRALDGLDGVDDEVLDDVRLVVTELVTNSVRHAELARDDRIRLEVVDGSDAVRIAVIDPGRGFEPIVSDRAPDRTSGWGLYLVERIASEWGVSLDGETAVWCEIRRR